METKDLALYFLTDTVTTHHITWFSFSPGYITNGKKEHLSQRLATSWVVETHFQVQQWVYTQTNGYSLPTRGGNKEKGNRTWNDWSEWDKNHCALPAKYLLPLKQLCLYYKKQSCVCLHSKPTVTIHIELCNFEKRNKTDLPYSIIRSLMPPTYHCLTYLTHGMKWMKIHWFVQFKTDQQMTHMD